jgi:asparagine synthase (glutamine-hydrolysing)
LCRINIKFLIDSISGVESMPGIFGLISKQQRETCERRLESMHAAMKYEKFYNSGSYINPDLFLYSGWSVHPGSFSDCMPITNLCKDTIIIFTGEVFGNNCAAAVGSVRRPINAAGMIGLYERSGDKFIERLNGWFSGLIIDLKTNKILIFNDRYGMQRLFIHESKDGFFFSSEAKALLAALPETREFHPIGLSEFLTCGCSLGSQSLYKGVKILPQGSLWTSERGEIKTRGSYFNLDSWTKQGLIDEKRCISDSVDLFGEVVSKYCIASEAVGISLTGGLDSRMIMACLDTRGNDYPCYTFGSMYRETFDVQTAREVAKICGQSHDVIVLGEEFLDNFTEHLEKAIYVSDGYLGLSGAAELYVNSIARNISPLRLTGNYGGELLRGHRAFKTVLPRGCIINTELNEFMKKAQSKFKELESLDAITFALFVQAPSMGYGRFAIERSQLQPRTPFMDNDLVKLIYRAPRKLLSGSELSAAIVSRYNPQLLKIPTDRGLLYGNTKNKGFTLRLQRKAFIKAEYLTSHGMPNWLAVISRLGIGRFFEKAFLGRDKFQHFRHWTDKRLGGSIKQALEQPVPSLNLFLNHRQVARIVHEHISGKKNYINEIDKILTLGIVYKGLMHNRSFLN